MVKKTNNKKNKKNKTYRKKRPKFKRNNSNKINNSNKLKRPKLKRIKTYRKNILNNKIPELSDELKYEPTKWNNNHNIRYSHNCYTYMLNKIDPNNVNNCKNKIKNKKRCIKPQPGDYSNMDTIKNYTCDNLNERVKKDNPNIRILPNNISNPVCGKDEYAGALVLRDNDRYHFYRQDKNKLWSHKPGSMNATNNDANKKKIKNILDANHNYKEIKYNNFCNYYCIPKNNAFKNHSFKDIK